MTDFTFNFTEEKLAKCIKKNKNPEEWFDALEKHLPKFGIITPARVAGFVSQTQHESLDFTILKENLNYSAKALDSIFGKYFVRAGRDANEYARQPEKIANVIYANRMGNGDEASGDGYKYRGRGILQLTGKSNYSQCSKDLFNDNELVDNPDLLLEPEFAVLSACWFWHKNKLNTICDAGDVVKLSKRINGGTIGLDDRIHHWNDCLKLFED
jgi:putative chitinase